MTNPIVFRIPSTPLVDSLGRLTIEWLVLINRLSAMGDQVVAVDIATLAQLVDQVSLNQLPSPQPDVLVFPEPPYRPPVLPQIPENIPQNDAALAQRLNDIEMWSLS